MSRRCRLYLLEEVQTVLSMVPFFSSLYKAKHRWEPLKLFWVNSCPLRDSVIKSVDLKWKRPGGWGVISPRGFGHSPGERELFWWVTTYRRSTCAFLDEAQMCASWSRGGRREALILLVEDSWNAAHTQKLNLTLKCLNNDSYSVSPRRHFQVLTVPSWTDVETEAQDGGAELIWGHANWCWTGEGHRCSLGGNRSQKLT